MHIHNAYIITYILLHNFFLYYLIFIDTVLFVLFFFFLVSLFFDIVTESGRISGKYQISDSKNYLPGYSIFNNFMIRCIPKHNTIKSIMSNLT